VHNSSSVDYFKVCPQAALLNLVHLFFMLISEKFSVIADGICRAVFQLLFNF
jgi:hypothetical protein